MSEMPWPMVFVLGVVAGWIVLYGLVEIAEEAHNNGRLRAERRCEQQCVCAEGWSGR